MKPDVSEYEYKTDLDLLTAVNLDLNFAIESISFSVIVLFKKAPAFILAIESAVDNLSSDELVFV